MVEEERLKVSIPRGVFLEKDCGDDSYETIYYLNVNWSVFHGAREKHDHAREYSQRAKSANASRIVP